MAIPTLPTRGSADWYAYAQGLDAEARGIGGKQPVATTADLVTPMWASTAPIIIQHRGSANGRYPEYSVAGMRAANESGFAIELDVERLTDGLFIPLHDATIDRTTTGTGNVTTLTEAQYRATKLRPIYPGANYAQVQSIQDALTLVGGETLTVPDLKGTWAATPAYVTAFLDLLDQRGLRRATLVSSSTKAAVLAAAARGYESMWQWDSGGGTTDSTELAALWAAGVRYLTSDFANTTGAFVTMAHGIGFKCIAYTPNTQAELATTVGKGFDGYYTDRPWSLSGRYAGSLTDPFASRVPSPDNTNFPSGATRVKFGRPGEMTLGLGDAVTVSQRQGWALPVSPYVRITFTVRFGSVSTAQDRWFAAFVGVQPPDGVYQDGAFVGQHGASFLGRRSGVMAVYGVADNVAPTQLGTATSGAAVAAASAEGTNLFQAEVNSTGYVFRNITQGTTVTVSNTNAAYRATANPSLAFITSGSEASFSAVSIEELTS